MTSQGLCATKSIAHLLERRKIDSEGDDVRFACDEFFDLSKMLSIPNSNGVEGMMADKVYQLAELLGFKVYNFERL